MGLASSIDAFVGRLGSGASLITQRIIFNKGGLKEANYVSLAFMCVSIIACIGACIFDWRAN